MADFVRVPFDRVPEEHLHALLGEYASRDGTDYGAHETSLDLRVAHLLAQIRADKIQLLFDVDSEQWDILPAEEAQRLLNDVDPS